MRCVGRLSNEALATQNQHSHLQPILPERQMQHGSQMPLPSFWNLSGSSTSSMTSSAMPSPSAMDSMCMPVDCDDCGQSLQGTMNQNSMDMDMDGCATQLDARCVGCGKNVCSHCSTSGADEQRRCLPCAGCDSLPAIMALANKLGVGWTGFTKGHRIYWRLV
jgi:hypothetical protein